MSLVARSAGALEAAADLARLLRSQWRPLEQLHAEQQRLLDVQLRHARSTVPFYRTRLGSTPAGTSAAALSHWPLIRRDLVQAERDAFLSEIGDRTRWQSSRTSGSTGRPLESLHDPRAWRQTTYLLKLRRLLASGWRPGQRIVIVEALSSEELAAHAIRRAAPGERWLQPRRYLSVFDPTEAHVEAYLRWRPQFIYALPSYLCALLPHWTEHLRGRVPLRALMTSGEWIPPARREQLEAGFDAPLLDVYGSTEFKEIAWQCPRRCGYHVNMESVWVEIVDAQGAPVPAGQPGELVVTSLLNHAMPLIRYATGDRALALEGACACGRASLRLDRFEGRTVDLLDLPDGRRLSPYALTTAIEGCPGLRQYRILQQPTGELDVPVVLHAAPADAVARLRTALEQVVGAGVRVAVRRVDALPRDPSGKCGPVRVLGPSSG